MYLCHWENSKFDALAHRRHKVGIVVGGRHLTCDDCSMWYGKQLTIVRIRKNKVVTHEMEQVSRMLQSRPFNEHL
jgi:hypothetical protein